jgi:hypothetical protein
VKPDPARAHVEARLDDVIPLLEVESSHVVPELHRDRQERVPDRSDRDDPVGDAEVALEALAVPDEVRAVRRLDVDDVELVVRCVDLGLDGQPRRHFRSVVSSHERRTRAAAADRRARR